MKRLALRLVSLHWHCWMETSVCYLLPRRGAQKLIGRLICQSLVVMNCASQPLISGHLITKKVFYSGSKCLYLGKQLLVEGIFWTIQHFSESEGIEAVHKPKDPSPQDRTQFYQSFLQQLSHCLFTFGLQDILEIVIVVFMHRQLVSPYENFRYLQELQEWFHSERPWPAHIVE